MANSKAKSGPFCFAFGFGKFTKFFRQKKAAQHVTLTKSTESVLVDVLFFVARCITIFQRVTHRKKCLQSLTNSVLEGSS
jgi:hypothetical protein